MANISKVIYGNTTLIDLTADTITQDKLLSGYTAHLANGDVVTGNCSFDSNTSSANATAGEILSGKTAYVKGNEVIGSMTNVGSQVATINTVSQSVTPTAGYHDGGGSISIDAIEQAKIIASNIKSGVEILGVTGNYSGSNGGNYQAKTATPYTTSQIILPDSEYDGLSQVTVNAIAYSNAPNPSGGYTITIGTVAP